MTETTSAPNNKAVAFGVKAKPKKPSASSKKRAKGAIKRGMISEKAAKRHLGEF